VDLTERLNSSSWW